MARHRALCEVWDNGHCLGGGTCKQDCHHTRRNTPVSPPRSRHYERPQSITVISLTNCPVALVPAPPAVTVRTPALVTVPARSPAVPAL